MAKKKANAKDLRGYATTSVAPLAAPVTAAAAAVLPPPSPDAAASSTSTTTAKKKKKEAAAVAAEAKISNIKPLPMPPASSVSAQDAVLLRLPPTPREDFATYAEFEDSFLQQISSEDDGADLLASSSSSSAEYSRFDLETVYETLLQRDGFKTEDVEQAMLVCRGNLASCHDWLSLHVPAHRLPAEWVHVPPGDKPKPQPQQQQPQPKQQPQQVNAAPRRRREIIMLDQDDDITTYGAPVNRKPARPPKKTSSSASPSSAAAPAAAYEEEEEDEEEEPPQPAAATVQDDDEEEDKEEDAYGRCVDKEFADEEFGDLTQDIDYMDEEEDGDDETAAVEEAPTAAPPAPALATAVAAKPPLPSQEEEEEMDPELAAEIAAELAKMQDLVWQDGQEDTAATPAAAAAPPPPAAPPPAPPAKNPTSTSSSDDECIGTALFDEDDNAASAPSTSTGVTMGAPRFEGRVPPSYRGTTPKQLLIAYCKREDMPNPVFSQTSALLGRVTVRTRAGETLTLTADHTCGTNDSVAQELVSVKALFQLGALANDQSYVSALPPDFRPIWKQLVEDEAARAHAALAEESKQRREFVSRLLLLQQAGNGGGGGGKRRVSPTAAAASAAAATPQQRSRRELVRNKPGAMLPLFEFKGENQAHLPIYTLKDEIIEAHFANQVVIISAETGSGKTTQVPQFLLEAYAATQGEVPRVCITQPRRISATSVANRVADELGDAKRHYVGYTIRGASTRRPTTSLLFCTSGVLLQHLSTSSNTGASTGGNEFDIIILDEVHERTVEGDVLMVCLKRMLAATPKLKVVLMSATMDSSRLSEYFGHCPVLHSTGGRVFPVETLYLEDLVERTGYVAEATGEKPSKEQLVDFGDGYSLRTCKTVQQLDEHQVNPSLIECALELMALSSSSNKMTTQQRDETWLVFLPGLKDIFRVESQLLSHAQFGNPALFQILLLHSSLAKDFAQFFETSHRNGGAGGGVVKRIILCTNIAETGITLPHVSGVVDTGRVNELKFNEKKNLTILKEEFCSKASSEQRKGRAGRVKSGMCIRLVTRATYHAQFAAFTKPEIQRVSLTEICLKLLNHEHFSPITDFFSEALDPPGEQSVQKALDRLHKLGCITPPSTQQDVRLTELGRVVSKLPMDAALGKILVFGALMRCAKRACVLVALVSFSSGSLFVNKKQVDNLLLEMQRFLEWEQSPTKRQFAREHLMDSQRVQEVQKLRNQYFAALQDEFPGQHLSDENGASNRLLASVLCAGLSVVTMTPGASGSGGYGGRNGNGNGNGHKFVCQDNIDARARLAGGASHGSTTTKFFTYLERMKVGQVFVSGLTPLHPVALVLFSSVPAKFVQVASRVDLGTPGSGWGQLRCAAPRTCCVFSLVRAVFDRAVERSLRTKQLPSSSSGDVFDLVLELVRGAE